MEEIKNNSEIRNHECGLEDCLGIFKVWFSKSSNVMGYIFFQLSLVSYKELG